MFCSNSAFLPALRDIKEKIESSPSFTTIDFPKKLASSELEHLTEVIVQQKNDAIAHLSTVIQQVEANNTPIEADNTN